MTKKSKSPPAILKESQNNLEHPTRRIHPIMDQVWVFRSNFDIEFEFWFGLVGPGRSAELVDWAILTRMGL